MMVSIKTKNRESFMGLPPVIQMERVKDAKREATAWQSREIIVWLAVESPYYSIGEAYYTHKPIE
jgi:hypothetical protein